MSFSKRLCHYKEIKLKIFILEIQELAQKQVAISTKRNSRPTIHVKAAILSEMSPIL